MDPFRLALRLARFVRRPPSKRWMIAAGAAVLFAIAIVTIEKTVGWPEALTVDKVGRRDLPR